jgi:membrane-associated protein
MDLSMISDQVLAAFITYGVSVVAGVILIAAVGVPLPGSLLLVAAGSFVAQGEMEFWPVVVTALGAAVVGDQVGYMLGRWGGQHWHDKLARLMGGADKLAAAERATQRWGGVAIFLSRWLLSPLGPALNLTSGVVGYNWLAFLGFVVLGEAVWVFGYVLLGSVFSTKIQELNSLLSDISTIAVLVVVVLGLGWMFVRSFKQQREQQQEAAAPMA